MGQSVSAFQEIAGVELEKVEVSGLVLGQQDNRTRFRAFLAGARSFPIGQIELASNDRLHACAGHIFGKFERCEQITAVGDRNRWHPSIRRHFCQRFDLYRTFEKRIGGMQAKRMHSLGFLTHNQGIDRG